MPEKPEKDVGLGVRLPLYAEGSQSVGWWALFITMLGDMAALMSLVFGYFFFWTSRPDFADNIQGPGIRWPALALVAAVAAWALTVAARGFNKRDSGVGFYGSLATAALLAALAAAAIVYGPIATRMDPVSHVYPATVWLFAIWVAVHLVTGAVMHVYCLARRATGSLSGRYDIDISVVTLYWHFTVFTRVIAVAVIAGFPLMT